MEVHGPGGIGGPGRIDLHRIQPQQPADIQGSGPIGDRAEISDVARLLNKLAEVPEVRADRVQELKALIDSGRFETPERVAGTVEKILEEL
jgi:hypothetical protein